MALLVEKNSRRCQNGGSKDIQRDILDAARSKSARAIIKSWPFYKKTPLVSMANFARAAHVGGVYAKSEAERLPLKSFKLLGAVYALAKAVEEKIPDIGNLRNIFDASSVQKIQDVQLTVVSATDGNHGTALSWASQILGVKCNIYLPNAVSPGREERIRSLGAQTIRVDGSYDDAVRAAHQDAVRNGWIMIQDTALSGFEHHCENILHGYTLLMEEAVEQLGDVVPTHIFVQAGVGGFAAAIAAFTWHHYAGQKPKIITVESENSPCVLKSLAAGKPVAVPGNHETAMGGIACGEVSALAWKTLKHTADYGVAIDDGHALAAIKLAQDTEPDIEIGETGIAGLAALWALANNKSATHEIGLNPDSVALVFITEGITDPVTFQSFVGGKS